MLILHSSLQGPACPHPHHSLSEGQGPQRPHSEYPMTVDCTTHSLVKEERNFPTSSLLMERGRFPGFQTSLGSGWRAPPCLHGGKDGTGHGGLAHPEAATEWPFAGMGAGGAALARPPLPFPQQKWSQGECQAALGRRGPCIRRGQLGTHSGQSKGALPV